jgi:class 3 adenylate cyclase
MLFTDVEGSTRLAQMLGDASPTVLAIHRRVIRHEVDRAGGTVEMTEGDSFFATFPAPAAAGFASDAILRALRMGIHVGPAQFTDRHWVGLEVHRAARIANAAHGGQIYRKLDVRSPHELGDALAGSGGRAV